MNNTETTLDRSSSFLRTPLEVEKLLSSHLYTVSCSCHHNAFLVRRKNAGYRNLVNLV